jgi:hypothetical protein
MMDDTIVKNNLDDIDGFVKSFDDGKYPNLKTIDTD